MEDFDCLLVWSTHIDDRQNTPSLKKLIQIAKEQGFTDWAGEKELGEFYDNAELITYNTIGKLEQYCDYDDDNLIMDALLEADQMMIALSSFIDSCIDFPCELAELATQHNKKVDERVYGG